MKTKLLIPALVFFYVYAEAQFHQNLTFNGNNNIVDCGNMASTLENVSAYTIEARVSFNSFSQWSTVFCKRTSDPTRDVVMQCYSSTGQIGIAVAGGYGYTSGTLLTGTWYHMAIVYNGANAADSSRLKLYIDGAPQTLTFLSTVPASTPPVAGSRFCLGAEYNGTTPVNISTIPTVPFEGSIDEVRIWSSARSASEILSGMNSELTLPQTNLVTYYKFNQGVACQSNTSDTLIDELNLNPGKLWNFALSGSTSNFTTVVETSVTFSSTLLTSNASPATYQWYNCGTHQIVPGATNQSFVTTSPGSFAVIVNQGCIDTSSCYTLISVGIDKVDDRSKLTIYPNPASDFLEIQFEKISIDVDVSIINLAGEIVKTNKFSNTKQIQVNLRDITPGMYILQVRNESRNDYFRIVKV